MTCPDCDGYGEKSPMGKKAEPCATCKGNGCVKPYSHLEWLALRADNVLWIDDKSAAVFVLADHFKRIAEIN